jgi:hypothetical protein
VRYSRVKQDCAYSTIHEHVQQGSVTTRIILNRMLDKQVAMMRTEIKCFRIRFYSV